MSQQQPVNNSGIGFFGLLGVAFIVLKLTGFIAWSWWWVLAPLWMPLMIGILVFVAIMVYMFSTMPSKRGTR